MTGVEYILLHVQEPILYIIRKQHRHSPQQGEIILQQYCPQQAVALMLKDFSFKTI